MSYSYTQRRKTIKWFKRQFGDKWRSKFRDHVDHLVAEMDGPLIGTLEEIVNTMWQR